MLRWLFADTHYQMFLEGYYSKLRNQHQNFEGMRNRLLKEHFGTANYFSRNMRKLGDAAEDFVINDLIMQRQWLREHWIASASTAKLFLMDLFSRKSAVFDRITSYRIFFEQVKQIKPDIVYLKNVNYIPLDWLKRIREHTRLLVGQVAYKVGEKRWLHEYNLLISSLPNLVQDYRKAGINIEYLRIGFDQSVLKLLKKTKKKYDVVFIGGFTEVHDRGNKTIEEIAAKIPVDVWGYKAERLPKASPLLKRFHGAVWGKDMFEIFYNSKIVLNRHSNISGNYANNMRLYEVTGVGSLLLTDDKKNIADLFLPDKEAVVYKSAKDAVDKIRYYLTHEEEHREIAKAGQKRTLREHTYENRMKELKTIIERYL